MPRTRVRVATKPATRSAPKPVIVQRPSTASSMQILSQDSEREDTPQPKRRGKVSTDHEQDDSEIEKKTVKVKNEPKDSDTEAERKQKKRTTKESDARPSAPKKRKPSPTIRTRAKTAKAKPVVKKALMLTPRSSVSSNSDSETELPATVSHTAMLPYLDLIRPYMTFQLSLSGLSGAAYEAAEASMTEVIDVVDRLKHSSPGLGCVEEGKTAINRRDGNGVVLVNKKKEEESIVARKLREARAMGAARICRELEEGIGIDSEMHDDDTDDSGTGSDTEVPSDEDEADALERRVDSITSASTGYESDSSSTDSAESESSGEDTDAIERREKNAVRRQKARQKRRNEAMREAETSGSESECEVDCSPNIKIVPSKEDQREMEMSIENKQEMERVKRMQQTSTRPLVAFSPVVW